MYGYGLNMNFADLLLTQRIAYDGSGNAEYVGYAAPGTAEESAGWMIYKLTYSGSSPVSKKWASGTNQQDKVWSNYAEYTYI